MTIYLWVWGSGIAVGLVLRGLVNADDAAEVTGAAVGFALAWAVLSIVAHLVDQSEDQPK